MHPGHSSMPVKRRRLLRVLRTASTVVLACVVSITPAAHASDGGFPAVYAERARLLVPGGDWQDGQCWPTDAGMSCSGAWVPEPRLIEVGRELAQHRAEQPPTAPPVTPVAVVVALACGVVLGGAAVGWLWTRVGH